MHTAGLQESQVLSALRKAREDGLTVDATGLHQDVDVLGLLQAAAAAEGWSSGQAPKFWKSGGPAPQSPLFHAPLPEEGIRTHTPADLPVSLARPVCTLYGIEAEIAFRIGRTVDREQALALTTRSVHAVVEAMTVAIEWVDSRWRQHLQSPLPWLQVDRLSHGALVISNAWQPYVPHDWSIQTCHVHLEGHDMRLFKGSHPLGDPSHVLLPWLLHATQHWGCVQEGTVVTTGSWCQILHAMPGQQVRVVFDEIGEASLQFAEAKTSTPGHPREVYGSI